MVFNPKDYHPQWADIRRQILDQANHKCEECGAPNGKVGDHDKHGTWWSLDALVHHFGIEFANDLDDCFYYDTFPRGSKPVTIVLTTAHLCHDKPCIDPTHLRALCQKHHLDHDREHHLSVQAENRRKRREDKGQLRLA